MSDGVSRPTATLQEIIAALGAHGEIHWPDRLCRDMELIRKGDIHGIQHLLSAYGGMGSFDDLFLSPENGTQISASEVSDVDERLKRLSSEAFRLAREIERSG